MTRALICGLALGLGVLLAPATGLAQDKPAKDKPAAEEPAPTKNEVAAKFIAETKKGLKDLTEAQAAQSANKLVGFWTMKEVTEATKKPITSLLEKMARSKKDTIALRGIEALGRIKGGDAAKRLLTILGKVLKAKEPSVDRYGACLRGLKAIADENAKVVKELTKLLNYKTHDVVGKAADALGGYAKAPGKLRKDLLESLIKSTEGTFSAAENKDKNQERKWNIIRSKVMKSMNALSRQSFKDPREARSWFNANKKNKKLWK